MPKTDNEDFKTTYRPPYPVDASACAKILNKYYDVKKDDEIVACRATGSRLQTWHNMSPG